MTFSSPYIATELLVARISPSIVSEDALTNLLQFMKTLEPALASMNGPENLKFWRVEFNISNS